MRKIRFSAIAVFLSLLGLVSILGIASAWFALSSCTWMGSFNSIAVCALALLLIYAYAIVAYRCFLHFFPLLVGNIVAGSRQEFIYQVYVLFYLILFNSLIRGAIIPIPLMRMVYLLLGAQLGQNTYSSGIIYDPLFVTIGANSVVGEAALLVPHVIEGSTLGHYRIEIGDHVTIGAHAIILSGVTIGDHAMVAANSVLTKGMVILAGEVWGGSPARRLR